MEAGGGGGLFGAGRAAGGSGGQARQVGEGGAGEGRVGRWASLFVQPQVLSMWSHRSWPGFPQNMAATVQWDIPHSDQNSKVRVPRNLGRGVWPFLPQTLLYHSVTKVHPDSREEK